MARRTEWGVRWTSPFGSHVTEEADRSAAYGLVRMKRLQQGCTSEVVRRDVTVSGWRAPGRQVDVPEEG